MRQPSSLDLSFKIMHWRFLDNQGENLLIGSGVSSILRILLCFSAVNYLRFEVHYLALNIVTGIHVTLRFG